MKWAFLLVLLALYFEVYANSSYNAVDVSCMGSLVSEFLVTNPCDTNSNTSARLLELYNASNVGLSQCQVASRIRVSKLKLHGQFAILMKQAWLAWSHAGMWFAADHMSCHVACTSM